MSEPDAIGEALSGAMVGRAVEPDAGEGDGYSHETACLNCGSALGGDYCHACGQRAHVHRTLGAFWHDLLHGALHFEDKIWRTLPLLAWKPGELTRRYIEGQRARFVSPIAIFLFSVFLMFAAFSLAGGDPASSIERSNASPEDLNRQLAGAEREAANEIRELEARKADLARRGLPTSEVDDDISSARTALTIQRDVFEGMGATPGAEGEGQQDATFGSGSNWFDRAYRKAKANPGLLFYKLQTNAYKFSWALIPISVPFVWLLFLHRKRYRTFRAYDHTVFVTYSLAFMSMLAILAALAAMIGFGWALALLALFVPFHMYRQLRGAYGLSRFSAAWRATALLMFSWIALSLFGLMILTFGIA